MGETAKSYQRRIKEGWFEKYAPTNKSGIDIGCQHDPLNHTFRRWDVIFGDPDATFMTGVPDNSFHTVYASHLLEHLDNPILAIQNWYRICSIGGHVIICVPHRDLYECKKTLPSMWNFEHKTFWLPEIIELPDTRSLKHTVLEAIPNAKMTLFRVLNEGYGRNGDEHPHGEFSIECIIKKN